MATQWDYKPGQAANEISKNLGGQYSGTAIDTMGAPGVQILMQGDQQRQTQQDSASQDLVKGQQSGAFSVLNTLLNKGYMSQKQKQAAMGHLQGVMNDIGGAGAMATQYAQDGGLSPEMLAFLAGEYGNARGKANTLAERGGLTIEEYNRILNSGRQDMMRQGRNAAEATFNQANASGSPFAAAALQAQTAANTGAGMAKQRAELDKYQSDTRMEGMKMLESLLGLASGTLMEQAGNKGKGLAALMDLLGLKTDVAGSMADMEGKTLDEDGGLAGYVDRLLSGVNDYVNVEDGSARTVLDREARGGFRGGFYSRPLG